MRSSVEWHLGLGEFGSPGWRKKFFLRQRVQRGEGGAADCEPVVVQPWRRFSGLGFWAAGGFGRWLGFRFVIALCFHLGGDAVMRVSPAVLPDPAIGSDDVCVHSCWPFRRWDYVGGRGGIYWRETFLQVGRVAPGGLV